MFSWPAVVRSCLLHHTYASIYVDKYSLSSIRIILTIFHELATINIYVPAHSRGKKKSTCRYGWCGTIHLRIRSCFNRKVRCYARHMSFSCAAHPWLCASRKQQEEEQHQQSKKWMWNRSSVNGRARNRHLSSDHRIPGAKCPTRSAGNSFKDVLYCL